ncbi:VQ motif-containing protein 10-like [Impatiens glandulifera]|uniref:VQ motif-containing protein 10-like n=1 Tax=Impatiens glandulifera TaxID=253017 RepID=UPI001FB15E36|nr:VQ motif-containing protein 10-like [Impatiens glandulifera]
MSAASTANDKLKVVYISTRYVETDPLSFKSVVQSLTGKKSSVDSWEEKNSTHSSDHSGAPEKRNKSVIGGNGSTSGGGGGGGGAMLETPGEFSCGDFSRALLEIPHSEELNSVYGDLLFNSQQQTWLTTNL